MKIAFFAMFVASGLITAFVSRTGSRCVNLNNSFSAKDKDTITPVKIQLEKTSFKDLSILFISDTAEQLKDMGPVLSKGYGELMKYAQENQLKQKKMLAWYYSVQAPWKMDIAIETDKLPAEISGRVKSRVEKGGEVLIPHVGSL